MVLIALFGIVCNPNEKVKQVHTFIFYVYEVISSEVSRSNIFKLSTHNNFTVIRFVVDKYRFKALLCFIAGFNSTF